MGWSTASNDGIAREELELERRMGGKWWRLFEEDLEAAVPRFRGGSAEGWTVMVALINGKF